jgi:MarR family transcriptional regulator, transcriptional regulator for hemolysin
MGKRGEAGVTQTVQVRRSLGFLLQDTARLMRRRFLQRAREAGLSLNQSEASVLVHVSHTPGVNQVTLANLLDIETISVVRLVDSLQALGLIERRLHPFDRRIRTLWLTDAGAEKITQIDAIRIQVRRQALAALSEAQHQQLLDLLTDLRVGLAAEQEVEPVDATEGASLTRQYF